MSITPRQKAIARAIALAFAAHGLLASAQAAPEQSELDTVVVTAPLTTAPLEITLDPKSPQQPIPNNDGAGFLKNVPGFSMIRKGGADGDPVLRGLGGSRLNILQDGAEFHGGCGNRMDPPTAYVFPETFDSVTIIKGPQTVLYGNGNSAGVVLFERDRQKIMPGSSGNLSLLGGSWGRYDGVAEAMAATDRAHVGATITHAESGDYADGNGNKVHSRYLRESATLQAGYKLDDDTRIDIDAIASRGEAAYADRTMDGSKFDRSSYGLALEKVQISPLLRKLSARVYTSYVDHVMDNYSLRTPTANKYAAMNPDRETSGARLLGELALSERVSAKIGADWRDDTHTLRFSGANTMMGMANGLATLNTGDANYYANKPRLKDYASSTTGVFGELTTRLDGGSRIITGYRHDEWRADRYSNLNGAFLASGTAGLDSAFLRHETEGLLPGATTYVGIGHNERSIDHWEATTFNGLTSTSLLKPEKTTQLDTGAVWRGERLKGSVSAYYAKVADYVLTRVVGMTNSSSNVDATRIGIESDFAWQLAPATIVNGSLAYVHADNDTRNVPLAQTPPLEARVGASHRLDAWTLGGVLRMVARQNRIDPGYGNIAGRDLTTATTGFATVGINVSYRANKDAQVSAGIDNLFDRTYAEHLNRANQYAYDATTTARIPEPGRTFWIKARLAFR